MAAAAAGRPASLLTCEPASLGPCQVTLTSLSSPSDTLHPSGHHCFYLEGLHYMYSTHFTPQMVPVKPSFCLAQANPHPKSLSTGASPAQQDSLLKHCLSCFFYSSSISLIPAHSHTSPFSTVFQNLHLSHAS